MARFLKHYICRDPDRQMAHGAAGLQIPETDAAFHGDGEQPAPPDSGTTDRQRSTVSEIEGGLWRQPTVGRRARQLPDTELFVDLVAGPESVVAAETKAVGLRADRREQGLS